MDRIIKKSHLLSAVCVYVGALVVATPSHAALVDPGAGLASINAPGITWLSDVNNNTTNGDDADHMMTWAEANAWSDGLAYVDRVRGITRGDWLLPRNNSRELARHTFVQSGGYWNGMEITPGSKREWVFHFLNGNQNASYKSLGMFLWAVRSGDVGEVPVPAALWLFLSGLLGLIGVSRERK